MIVRPPYEFYMHKGMLRSAPAHELHGCNAWVYCMAWYGMVMVPATQCSVTWCNVS